jgi:integrase
MTIGSASSKMTTIKVHGVKTYRSKGRLYHYHRATGIRIEIDVEATPERFLARVRELDAIAPDMPKPTLELRKVKTLGGLFDAWRQSEEWKSLRVQTRDSYERVTDPTKGSLSAVRGRPLNEFTPPFVVGLRDVVAKKHRRWMANYAVKVLRVAFGWGRVHGWCTSNPAQGVPLLPASNDAPQRNRAWSPEEFQVVCEKSSPRLRLAIMLAHFAGMRVGDVIAVTWNAWDGEYLSFRQSKTGHAVQVRAPTPLREELMAAKREGERILVNHQGQPYTRDGLQSNLWKMVTSLALGGLVKPGLCFHGLRHSLGAALYDLGLDREARKAALGHTSDAASMVYERGGNRRAASDRAFAALDAHLTTSADKIKNAK